jgi:hypothetical protein
MRIRGREALLGQGYDHVAFCPAPLPASVPLGERTYKLVSEADRAVGRLDAGAWKAPKPVFARAANHLTVRP